MVSEELSISYRDFSEKFSGDVIFSMQRRDRSEAQEVPNETSVARFYGAKAQRAQRLLRIKFLIDNAMGEKAAKSMGNQHKIISSAFFAPLRLCVGF